MESTELQELNEEIERGKNRLPVTLGRANQSQPLRSG